MRIIRLLHKWTGLIADLFLFLLSLTGAMIIVGKLFGSYAPFFNWCVILHKTLFLGNTGSLIVGIASLLLVFLILTGFILWGKELRNLLRGARKRGEGFRRALGKSLSMRFPNSVMGWHVAGGMYASVPLLLMALTGLTWSFGWYARIVYYLFDTPGSGGWGSNLFHTLHALHVGSWGQPWSRILWLIAALLGASLSVTGFWLWLRHRHPGRSGDHR